MAKGGKKKNLKQEYKKGNEKALNANAILIKMKK